MRGRRAAGQRRAGSPLLEDDPACRDENGWCHHLRPHPPAMAQGGGRDPLREYGNVGRPKDGDWRPGYASLDIGEGHVGVEFVRVEYEVEASIWAIGRASSPHPPLAPGSRRQG